VPRSDLLLICYPLVNLLLAPATCGAIANCLCSLAALSLPCSALLSHLASPPLSPAIIIIASAVAAPRGRGQQQRSPSASWVVIPIDAAVTTSAVFPAAASAASIASVRMRLSRRTHPLLVVTNLTAGGQRLATVPRQQRRHRHRQQRRRSMTDVTALTHDAPPG